MELVVFTGLQGSGKSTFYRTRFAATHFHVSKDNFRSCRNRNARQRLLIETALGRGESVVVDNTNPTIAERDWVIELGRDCGARVIGYYFEPLVEACLVRNAAREGRARVPDCAIHITA